MKRRIIWLGLAVLATAGLTGAYLYAQNGASAPRFRTAPITRGTVTAAVSATGNLNAVITVQVGSQVSGQIRELFADFNTAVKRGQLIARIDPASFEARASQARAELEASEATVLNQRAQVERARADVDNARAALAGARAQTAKSEVTLADAKRDLDRKSDLSEKEFIARSERDTAQATYDSGRAQLEANRAQEVALASAIRSAEAQLRVAEAQLKSAEATVKQKQAALDQAAVDLDRTYIRAPVDGVVVSRNVDTGQTVAASLQAPTLFVIAQDLSKMQVDTNVDEADIGRIAVGQVATFTVDSFAGQQFAGRVVQIRKSPKTIQNVVTYNVVVAADNPDLKLLPGMTANLRIVTETKHDVVRVPNAALRFRPPGSEPVEVTPPGQFGPGQRPGAGSVAGSDEIRERLVRELRLTAEQQASLEPILEQARAKFLALSRIPAAQRRAAALEIREDARQKIRAFLTPDQQVRYDQMPQGQSAHGERALVRPGQVWITAPDATLRAVTLRLGISDGSFTELVGGDLREGQEVIVGASTTGTAAPRPPSTSGSSPRFRF
jgi:HlyD family secretion protein